LHCRFGHLALLLSRIKIRGFFNFNLGIGFPRGHLGVTSEILGLGARREAKETQTEEGKGWRSSIWKWQRPGNKKGENPRSYHAVKYRLRMAIL